MIFLVDFLFDSTGTAELETELNTAMTVTYFEIGRRILEKEQQGEKRAAYGKYYQHSESH